MDSRFDFLSTKQVDVLKSVLARRNPALADRLQRSQSVSRSDAEELMYTLSDEFTDNLDSDWEPTDYGRIVSGIMASVNAARIETWPE